MLREKNDTDYFLIVELGVWRGSTDLKRNI